jgi:hypothetical protein
LSRSLWGFCGLCTPQPSALPFVHVVSLACRPKPWAKAVPRQKFMSLRVNSWFCFSAPQFRTSDFGPRTYFRHNPDTKKHIPRHKKHDPDTHQTQSKTHQNPRKTHSQTRKTRKIFFSARNQWIGPRSVPRPQRIRRHLLPFHLRRTSLSATLSRSLCGLGGLRVSKAPCLCASVVRFQSSFPPFPSVQAFGVGFLSRSFTICRQRTGQNFRDLSRCFALFPLFHAPARFFLRSLPAFISDFGIRTSHLFHQESTFLRRKSLISPFSP